MSDQDLFDRAKARISIEDLAGKVTKLRGNANQQRGACPIQGCGSKSKTVPFAVWPKTGRFRCYSCGAWGDVVDLEHQLGGGSSADAARRLLGEGFQPSKPRRAYTPEDRQADDRKRQSLAQRMWREARPILGTLAEKYLLGRAIHPAVVARAAARLRFHPAALHSFDEGAQDWVRAPALIASAETERGPTGGVHCTYLLRDGSGRDKALGKKMWGVHVGRDGRPAGAWLIGPELEGFAWTPLVLGEGIETTLSLASLAWMQGRRVRAVAALSLSRLQGGVERDDQGCLDLDHPKADLSVRPFIWPPPGAQPWPEVLVGIDHDMKPLKVMGRTGRGRSVPMILDAEARAALCASLVKQHWRAAGEPNVRTLLPPLNSDWNNELQRRVERELARSGACA
ncbi:CHC2 zinc finger domain-containing protein [Caulobacter sp. BP25]|uniref:DUF7146 domain-containing protein n=1 Tax=Caulobacter sp. BP25 TaxID=2048900 RepID=UPI000C12B678|nr:CHC2 zinc finger domain-containing protein [Caulobacter sp. BP25]PHY20915.1 hypothetical protein CSW59_06810 [Caulobacter sp. BP25]